MNHRILRMFIANLLPFAVFALCSGCTRLIAAGHLNQSALDIAAGQYETAIAENTKAIAMKPDYHLAYINRAVAYTYTRRYDLALEDLRRAIALDPEEAVTHLNYVSTLVFMRREQEAAEHAESFLRTHPNNPLMMCDLAMALERRKEYSRAHELASQCVSTLESRTNASEVPQGLRLGAAGLLSLRARLAARVGRKDEAL